MRFFVAPTVDDPRALYRFDDKGGSPEALRDVDGALTWITWPTALRFTCDGDDGADEIDQATFDGLLRRFVPAGT